MAPETASEEVVQPEAVSRSLQAATPEVDEFLKEADIRAQIERILECEQFRTSAKISSFLRYVAETALSGRAHEIKETSIAVSVYGRDPSYDPKLDTVVRTEARRLRQKLDRYFEQEGKSDPIRVWLPKGGYVPVFKRLSVAPVQLDAPAPGSGAVFDATISRTRKPGIVEGISSSWKWRSVILLAMIFIAVSTILHYSRPRSLVSNSTSMIVPLTSFPGEAYQPDVSPDSKSVAFIWNNASAFYNIYIVQMGGKPLRVTSSNSMDIRPAWSPDGTSLAFLRIDKAGTHVMLTAFPGGSEKLLFDLISSRPWGEDQVALRNDTGPNWTTNGKAIVVSDTAPSGQGLGLYEFDLGNQRLTALTNPSADERDLNPVVSPNGRWIGFTRFSSYDSADIFLLSTSDHTERKLTADRTDIQGLAWSRDSRNVVFSSNRAGAYQLWKVSLDGNVIASIPTSGESAIQPAVSRDGRFIIYVDASLRSQLLKVHLSPSEGMSLPVPVSPSTRRSHSAQFSPDGSHIAFVSDRSGKWELWTSGPDGTDARQITNFNAASVGSPRWSPNSKIITFDARPDGRSAIFVVSIDGRAPRKLSPLGSEEKQPAWSPDGAWIYFNSNRDGTMRLWKMREDGTNAIPVFTTPATDPRFTRDGRSLLYTKTSPGLWSLDIDSREISRSRALKSPVLAGFGQYRIEVFTLLTSPLTGGS